MLRIIISLWALIIGFNAGACTDINQRIPATVIGHTAKTALAYVNDAGYPMIMMDYNILRTAPKNVLEFIYLHECGHHKYGHAIEARYGFSPTDDKDEHDADCYAKREFVARHGQSAFDDLLKDLLVLNGPHRNSRIKSCN